MLTNFVPILLSLLICLLLLYARWSNSNDDGKNFVTNFTIDSRLDGSWKAFVRTNNKFYKSEREKVLRRLIFQENIRRIEEHNRRYREGKETYHVSINHFGDLTDKEFFDTYLGPGGYFAAEWNIKKNFSWTKRLPESVDWREKGLVTGVRNQGACGSCWAFSVVGAIEGQLARRRGTLIKLSEQQLVDCTTSYGNGGCSGGLPEIAYEYIRKNGITSESAYRYMYKEQKCKYQENMRVASITDHVSIPPGDEQAMKEALAVVGPLSAALYVSANMRFYRDGLYTDTCPKKQNHAVVVVGYGSFSLNHDYWIVKNSWGPSWGVNGYIKLARNRQSQCCIADYVTFPKI